MEPGWLRSFEQLGEQRLAFAVFFLPAFGPMNRKRQKKAQPQRIPLSTPAAEDLAARISARLTAKRVRFVQKRMFGGICFMVSDKMCVGTARNLLMVRFDPDLHEEVLDRPGAGPMDFTGKPMRGYVFVQPVALGNDAVLTSWLDLAMDYNPRAKRSKRASAGRAAKTKK
jgi:TfoX/Sxy family transcriptional regulator of competence genes